MTWIITAFLPIGAAFPPTFELVSEAVMSFGKQLVSFIGITALAACSTPVSGGEEPAHEDYIVAAVEADGVLAVLRQRDGALVKKIPLAADGVPVMIHNVQGDESGRFAWATVLPGGEHASMGMNNELVSVDLTTFAVGRRIALGAGLHVAHVVVHGSTAYVTANEADQVLFVDLVAGAVTRTVQLPTGAGPHGARLTPDGRRLVVAGMGSGGLYLVDTATGAVTSRELPGRGVQAAVLPDGSAAFVSVYDTRQVGRLDFATNELRLFDLPAGTAGPLQIYPSPDSRYLWVADQGLVDHRPAGHRLLELDAKTGALVLTAEVGHAPHGVVSSEDGRKVWVTLVEDSAVQAIDAASGAVLSTTAVGAEPNGITCVHADGAMP